MGRKSLFTCLVALHLVLAAAISAVAKENTHNVGDCLFCHKTVPRFGVDTRATVTFKESGGDDPALCLRCHKPEENLHPMNVKPGEAAGTQAPRNLPLGSSPGFEGTVVCTTCHFIHAANADSALLQGFPGSQNPIYSNWQGLCRECHGAQLEKRSPHAGDDKACAFCHQSKPKQGEKVTVAARGEALCNFCHGALQNKHFARANPFGADVNCYACHDPHLGKDRPGRLKQSYLLVVKSKVTVDPHYRKTLCFTCHKDEPKAALLTDDINALCNRCHGSGKIAGDPHPLAKPGPEVKVPQGWPLKGGSLTCLTCHRAGHLEDKPYFRFLRGGPYKDRNDICFQCHDRDVFKKKNPHQDINQMKGCDFCHSAPPVPGKDTAKTAKLMADIGILCLRCHDYTPHPAEFLHTVRLDEEKRQTVPEDLPLNADGSITCTTCHNPHIEEMDNQKLRGGVSGIEICARCHRM